MASRTRRKSNQPDKLENLPDSSIICADANILAYYFNKTPDISIECAAFVNRCAEKKLKLSQHYRLLPMRSIVQ